MNWKKLSDFSVVILKRNSFIEQTERNTFFVRWKKVSKDAIVQRNVRKSVAAKQMEYFVTQSATRIRNLLVVLIKKKLLNKKITFILYFTFLIKRDLNLTKIKIFLLILL